jgi:hypothetical protein
MPGRARRCTDCGRVIPEGRIKVIPFARLCVHCAEKIRGETKLKVRIGIKGKSGSLKHTGVVVESVELLPKALW